MFNRIQAKEAEFYNYVNVDEVAEMFEIDKSDIEIIFNYWKLKRRVSYFYTKLFSFFDLRKVLSYVFLNLFIF